MLGCLIVTQKYSCQLNKNSCCWFCIRSTLNRECIDKFNSKTLLTLLFICCSKSFQFSSNWSHWNKTSTFRWKKNQRQYRIWKMVPLRELLSGSKQNNLLLSVLSVKSLTGSPWNVWINSRIVLLLSSLSKLNLYVWYCEISDAIIHFEMPNYFFIVVKVFRWIWIRESGRWGFMNVALLPIEAEYFSERFITILEY